MTGIVHARYPEFDWRNQATRGGVYAIEAPSGSLYVGSSVDMRARWKKHRVELRAGTHHNEPLQRAAEKYGLAGLRFRVLLFASRDLLTLYEQIAIDALKPEYNTLKTAYSHLGAKRSPDSCARIAAANTGRRHSVEARKRMSAASRGKKRTPFTDEHRENIAAANRGAKRSETARAAMRYAQLGKKQTPETIAKRKATWEAKRV